MQSKNKWTFSTMRNRFAGAALVMLLMFMVVQPMVGCNAIQNFVQSVADSRDTDGDGTVTRVEAVAWYQGMIDSAESVSTSLKSGLNEANEHIDILTAYRDELMPGAPDYEEVSRALDILYRERDRIQVLIRSGDAKVASVQAVLDNLPDNYSASSLDGQMFGEVVAVAAPLIPPPWNMVVTGIAALFPPLLLKLKQVTGERNTIIASVDEGKYRHPELAVALDLASSTIRGIQGLKLAKKVDKIRDTEKKEVTA